MLRTYRGRFRALDLFCGIRCFLPFYNGDLLANVLVWALSLSKAYKFGLPLALGSLWPVYKMGWENMEDYVLCN